MKIAHFVAAVLAASSLNASAVLAPLDGVVGAWDCFGDKLKINPDSTFNLLVKEEKEPYSGTIRFAEDAMPRFGKVRFEFAKQKAVLWESVSEFLATPAPPSLLTQHRLQFTGPHGTLKSCEREAVRKG